MTLFILAFSLPFALVLTALCMILFRRTPHERAKRLFIRITDHKKYNVADFPKLLGAVRDLDLDYLLTYLRELDRP